MTTNNITTLKNHINRIQMKYPSHHLAASASTEELTVVALFSGTSTDVLFSSCLLLLFIIIIIITIIFIIIMCMSLTIKVALFPKTSSYHEIH